MKSIIANANNVEKMNKAIADAEGRATARTISADDIMDALDAIEKRLGIPKAHMVGIRAEVDVNAQTFPNAYKYRPESTQFTAVRTASGWKVTDIYRGTTRGPSTRYVLALTDKARESIIKSMEHFD